ncbi:O-antigen ligase [Capnocytophaga sp. oral taxon 329]|nr:O-antigen ligase family protein [Capnocytophaga sp. oral taxon 329]
MSRDIENISSIKKIIFFILFLLYSFLPGIYKILGNQMIMLFSIPIVLILLYLTRKSYKPLKIDVVFIIFFCYVILQSILWMCSPWVNRIGILMGMYLNIFPMLGFFISRGIEFKVFKSIILNIVLIHCILGIILYPFFRIVDAGSPLVKSLTEGVAYGRMSGISGSLIFGNLIMIGFIMSFFTKKMFLPLITFCLLFNAQRSAWLAAASSILIYLLYLLKNLRIKKILTYTIFILVFVIIGISLISNYINFDIDFMLSRLDSVGNASSERQDQWVSGLKNFISYPLGTGVGQVGHVAARFEGASSIYNIVPDGDYFRILSEYGMIGGLFYMFVILSVFLSFIFIKKMDKIVVLALITGYLIQMVGSNISEFYFTNFVYWFIFGYYFYFLNDNYKFKI